MKMIKKKIKRSKSTKEPSFFLEKLFKILKDKANADLIHWNEDGTIIIITDPFKFANKILPKFCKHDNYSSFNRQLNIYGFHKINNIKNSKSEQFKNENFTKNKSLKEIKAITRNNIKYDNDEDELNEKEIKEEINLLDKIDKQDDDQKCLEYKKLIQNGKLDNKTNIKILEFLFNKNKEMNEFSKKANNDINEIKNKIKINLQNIQSLNQKYNFDINNNKYFEEKNTINDEKAKKNCIIPTESFGCFNTRLIYEFKDVDDKKIEKPNKNLGTSFVEGLSVNFDTKKNNNYINPSQTQHPSSFFNLNRTLYIDQNYINYNDNTILRNNMTNSFI